MILAYTSGTNSIVQFLTALLVFVFVILLTRFTLKWVGTYQKIASGNKNFEVIETFKVTSNKFMQIIKIGSRYFLVGIGKEELTYFTELNPDELDLSVQDTRQATDNFKVLIDKAKEKIHKRSDENE